MSIMKHLGCLVPKEHNCNGKPWMWPSMNGAKDTLQHPLRTEEYRVLVNERAFFANGTPINDSIFITTARDPNEE